MDTAKHPLEKRPATAAHAHLLQTALNIARERGQAPDAWSLTDLGLDSAPYIGIMLWAGPVTLATIDPSGHMYWFTA